MIVAYHDMTYAAFMVDRKLSKADFEALANFRYQLRRFLRFSEEVTHANGVRPLQYLLLLQLRGFPSRDWATVAELAERLQAKHHGVVALVTRCEAAGWVRRRTSRSDQRSVEVHLTTLGRSRVEELARLHRDELRTVKSGFIVTGIRRHEE
jgi:DNA-binding MarR family transcriptional regulator